jgi:hypothetical protein
MYHSPQAVGTAPRLAATGAIQVKTNRAHALMRAHGFTQTDLEANRLGKLSPAQAALLRARARGQLVMGALLFVAGGFVLTGLSSMLVLALLASRGRVPGVAYVFTGALSLAFVAALLLAALWIRNCFREISEQRVGVAEGVVTAERVSGDADAYFYVLDGTSYQVPAEAYTLVKDDPSRYRVYYAPRSRWVVGMEPL